VTVSSKNVGSASDVHLNLTLPAGYTVTHTYADRGPGCSGAASNLTCDVAWITGGTDTHVQIFGVVGVAGEHDVTATVTPSPKTEFDSSDNTATLKVAQASTPPRPSGGGSSTPHVLTAPAVTGAAVVGHVLHVTAPRWSAKPTTVAYRWQVCSTKACSAISRATAAWLRVIRAFVGRRVRAVVTTAFGGMTVQARSPLVRVRLRIR
jgi:Domain of unknown function DUF11